MNRAKKTMLLKAAKSLDRKSAEIASLKAQLADLREQVNTRQRNKRQRVAKGPNETFTMTEEIKKAQDILKEREVTEVEAKRRTRRKYKSEAITISSDESSSEEDA